MRLHNQTKEQIDQQSECQSTVKQLCHHAVFLQQVMYIPYKYFINLYYTFCTNIGFAFWKKTCWTQHANPPK